MKILITGGTGFIGSHIRDELLRHPKASEAEVVCMTRDPKGKRHADPRVSYVAGDVRDAASLERATEGVGTVGRRRPMAWPMGAPGGEVRPMAF